MIIQKTAVIVKQKTAVLYFYFCYLQISKITFAITDAKP